MKRLVCLSWIALLVASTLSADLLRSVCTAPTTITIPWQASGPARVFLRGADGRWRPAEVKSGDGSLVFTLDPAKLGAEVMLLVDPPATMVLDDRTGPAITALKLDGKSFPARPELNLGTVKEAPRSVSVTFEEACNTLDPDAFRVAIDGLSLPAGRFRVSRIGEKQATVRLSLRDLDYGKHEIVVTAQDTSPQSNVTRLRATLSYIESGNVALAALGAKVAVDSSFAGYESLVPINDGNTTMPGDSCGNDITWASTETNTDHWAEISFPRPTAIKEVTVYWAAYTNVAHAARHFEIQVPDGAGWKAVYKSPAEGESPTPLTTARFEPVTVEKFRVFMPAGGGSATRPNLLWIGEIKAR